MDFYTLLHVSATATADEIDRAFRRLARRCHPGVNPGDSVAVERYRQIQEAYGVLGDPDRRREYDSGGAAPAPVLIEATVSFQGFDFSAAAEGPRAATFSELFADVFHDAAQRGTSPDRGAPLEVSLRLSFEEALRGGQFPLSIVREDRCSSCGGEGRVTQALAACGQCGGSGALRWARGHMVFTKACEVCDGSGRISMQVCRTCRGAGLSPRSEVVTLAVPAGIESGARMAVPGRGHVSERGGPAGDLYVTIDVAPHPFFTRDGRDLHLTLPVAVHEAALGATVRVPTPGGSLSVALPAGSSSGQTLRLSGLGVSSSGGAADPDAGDLVIHVELVLPPVRDRRSRELLKEFAKLNDADVRAHLFRD